MRKSSSDSDDFGSDSSPDGSDRQESNEFPIETVPSQYFASKDTEDLVTRVVSEEEYSTAPGTDADKQEAEVEHTVLSDYIWRRKWDLASQRLQLEEYAHEARTEITLPCFSSRMCRALPLHLACAMRPLPPATFISSLLKSYPEAAQKGEGMWAILPLHFACETSESLVCGGKGDLLNDESIYSFESCLSGATDSFLYSSFSMDPIFQSGVLGSVLDSSSDAASVDQIIFEKEECHRLLLPPLVSSLSPVCKSKNERSNAVQESSMKNQARIVEILLQAFPESALVREQFRGMLPIHIAAEAFMNSKRLTSESTSEIIDMLRSTNPDIMKMRDNWGQTAEDILRWGEEQHSEVDLNLTARFSLEKQCSDTSMTKAEKNLTDNVVSKTHSNIESNSHDTGLLDNVQCNEGQYMSLKLRGQSLTKNPNRVGEVMGKKRPSPFFEVAIVERSSAVESSVSPGQEFLKWTTLYRSYPISKDCNPFWGFVEFHLGRFSFIPLCELLMKVTVFSCNTRGKHKSIGYFVTPLDGLEQRGGQISFPLLGRGKKSGFIHILNISVFSWESK